MNKYDYNNNVLKTSVAWDISETHDVSGLDSSIAIVSNFIDGFLNVLL